NGGNYGRSSRKCFVCHKTGCWSIKHTLDERRDAYQQFKSNRYVKDSSPSAYATFLMDFKGNEPLDTTDDNDLRQYFKASVPFEDAEDEQLGDTFHTRTTFFNNAPISGYRCKAALQTAIKTINNTAGPNGIVPTLLVFSAYPHITNNSPPSPDIIRQAAAVHKATNNLHHYHTTHKVNKALKQHNGPHTTPIKDIPLGSQLLSINNKDYTININGPRKFQSTSVKPYHTEQADSSINTIPNPLPKTNADNSGDRCEDTIVVATGLKIPVPAATSDAPETTRRLRGRPRKTPVNGPQQGVGSHATAFLSPKEQADLILAQQLRSKGIITTPGEPFEESTKREISALMDRDMFEIITYDPSIHSKRVFKSRIINEVKDKTTEKPYEKSRLVIQGYADNSKEAILVQSAIQRASQRNLLALTPSLLRDGKQMWL
ncbi:hypothetical protein CSUB01_12550, partial [Colletotrichum sublineola]